jgi:hypothetical protein
VYAPTLAVNSKKHTKLPEQVLSLTINPRNPNHEQKKVEAPKILKQELMKVDQLQPPILTPAFVDGFFLDADGGEFLFPRVLVFPFLLALVVAALALFFVVTFAFFVPIALSSPASAKSSSEFDGSTIMEDRQDIASAAAIRSACSFSSIDVDSFCFFAFRLVVIICIFSGLKIDVNVRILIHIAEIHISRFGGQLDYVVKPALI